MSENESNVREITLADIFRAIKKKAVAIIATALIALIVGAAAGATLTIISNATYGAKSEFNVTSKEANNYILALLRSDNFVETLLLDDHGLPANKAGTAEYQEIVDMQTQLELLKKEKKDLNIKLEKYPNMLSNAQRLYDGANSNLSSLTSLLGNTLYGSNDKELIEKYEDLRAEAKLAMESAKAEYEKTLKDNQDIEEKIEDLGRDIIELKADIENKKVNLLTDFRNDDAIQSQISKIKESIFFNYVQEITNNDNKEQTNNSRSILNVTVAVDFDKQLAADLVNKINLRLPSYVENSITVEDEKDAPTCTFNSGAGIVGSVNYQNPVVQAAKYGLIALAAGAVVSTCVVIVVELFVKNPDAESKKEEKIEE